MFKIETLGEKCSVGSTLSWEDCRPQGQRPWIPDPDSRFTPSLPGPWPSVSLPIRKRRVGIIGD